MKYFWREIVYFLQEQEVSIFFGGKIQEQEVSIFFGGKWYHEEGSEKASDTKYKRLGVVKSLHNNDGAAQRI